MESHSPLLLLQVIQPTCLQALALGEGELPSTGASVSLDWTGEMSGLDI